METANGKLRFKGAVPISDISINITDNSENGGNAFSLIGNPYPSFVFAGNALEGINDFLTHNTEALFEKTLWLWDKATSAYITVNNTSDRFIAPAQGFFIKSKTGGSTITFTKAMQSHQSTGNFNKGENTRPEIKINILNNGVSANALIYYYDQKTEGFDNGYDSTVFTGTSSPVTIFTKLVSLTDDRDFSIQTLPTENYQAMVIPIGIKALANSEIILSSEAMNLPVELAVYLEDKLEKTMTLLSSDEGTYKTTVNSVVTEDRFFLHTKNASVLNLVNPVLNNINVFKTSETNLKISGLEEGQAKLTLFNILGVEMLEINFTTSNVQNITLPKIEAGIYILQLKTASQELHKKIIFNE